MSVISDPEPRFRDAKNPTRDELRALGLWRLRNPGRLRTDAPFTQEEHELAQPSCFEVARERAESDH
jgi:hypothetical protein